MFFIEKEILLMSQKIEKFALNLYHAISRLLHVFFMISHSASPRAQSFKKHAITYTYNKIILHNHQSILNQLMRVILIDLSYNKIFQLKS